MYSDFHFHLVYEGDGNMLDGNSILRANSEFPSVARPAAAQPRAESRYVRGDWMKHSIRDEEAEHLELLNDGPPEDQMISQRWLMV